VANSNSSNNSATDTAATTATTPTATTTTGRSSSSSHLGRLGLPPISALFKDERTPLSMVCGKQGQGRYMVAKRPVGPGEVLLRCPAYGLVVSDQSAGKACHRFPGRPRAAGQRNKLFRCGGCGFSLFSRREDLEEVRICVESICSSASSSLPASASSE
jgi:hypothetical protein